MPGSLREWWRNLSPGERRRLAAEAEDAQFTDDTRALLNAGPLGVSRAVALWDDGEWEEFAAHAVKQLDRA